MSTILQYIMALLFVILVIEHVKSMSYRREIPNYGRIRRNLG